MSFIRWLVAPFLALAQVLLVLGEFVLGFLSIMAGCALLPGSPIAGWIFLAFGIGTFLNMVFKGISEMCSGKNPREEDR